MSAALGFPWATGASCVGEGSSLSCKGVLFASDDGGRSWERRPTDGFLFLDVRFLDATHGWTLDAKANTILFSGDGGQHWSIAGTIPSNSNGVVRDFQFVTAQVGWVLGADSRGLPILKTVDGGQTWTTQLAP